MVKKTPIPIHRIADGSHVTLYPLVPQWENQHPDNDYLSGLTLEQRALLAHAEPQMHANAQRFAALCRSPPYESTVFKYAMGSIFVLMGLSQLAPLIHYEGSPLKGAIQVFGTLLGSIAIGAVRAEYLRRQYPAINELYQRDVA